MPHANAKMDDQRSSLYLHLHARTCMYTALSLPSLPLSGLSRTSIDRDTYSSSSSTSSTSLDDSK